MSSRARLARLRRWPRAERALLARAVLLLAAYPLALRCFGLRRARAILAPAASAAPPLGAESICRVVACAARNLPWRPRCLPASLVAADFLAARGFDARLRLGVRREGGGIEAHAWVEHGGAPVFDVREPGARFASFDEAIFTGERA